MASFSHKSVLLQETVEGLSPERGGVFFDCTLGGGGHSEYLLSHYPKARLVALDQDTDAIEAASARLSPFKGRVRFVHTNFENIAEVAKTHAPDGISGVMMDLGVSSHQLDTPERGFSYHTDSPLDMRMDQSAPFTARELVNTYSESELRHVIADYGEEHRASAVARAIVKAREEKAIETTLELAEIVKGAFPERERFEGKHPARRTFQALRIEVNRELEIIPKTIADIVPLLIPGGRISIITFHSLEDRLVKESYKKYIDGCTCPRDFPVCVCGFKPQLFLCNRKPILPTEAELRENPRSRSAKLRVAEKIG